MPLPQGLICPSPSGGSPAPVLPACPFQNGGVSSASHLGCIPKTSGPRPLKGGAREGCAVVPPCTPTPSSPHHCHMWSLCLLVPAQLSAPLVLQSPAGVCPLSPGRCVWPRGAKEGPTPLLCPLYSSVGASPFMTQAPPWTRGFGGVDPPTTTPHPPQCSDPELRGSGVTGCPGPPPALLATVNQQLSFTPGLLQAGDPEHSGSGD